MPSQNNNQEMWAGTGTLMNDMVNYFYVRHSMGNEISNVTGATATIAGQPIVLNLSSTQNAQTGDQVSTTV